MYTILTGVMKFWIVLLHPAQEVNSPFAQHIHTVHDTHPLVTHE